MHLFADKPGAPQFLKVASVAEREIGIKWAEPQDDGGSDITGALKLSIN